MSAGSWGSWSEGMGGGHTGGPEGVSGQRHNEPRARQHTSSPSKAGVPVLLAPSARCAHSGSGSGASTRSRGRGAYPRPAPQPRSQPRRLLCANPTNLLRPAQEPSSTLSRGKERALQWPPQASAPVLQGGGSPSRQLAGALGGVRAQKERDLQAETAAGPQARPAPHRPLGRTRRRSLPDPLPTQASETSPRTSSREDDLAGSSDPVSDPHNA